jgi:hypothetical protein
MRVLRGGHVLRSRGLCVRAHNQVSREPALLNKRLACTV